MINLKQFTKEQQFDLVSTALADTWFQLRQRLSDSKVVELKDSQLSLKFGKLGFQVIVFRPSGLIFYTIDLAYLPDNSLVYDIVSYQRNKPVFGKDIHGYYSEETGFEGLSSDLPEEFLIPYITGVREVVLQDKVVSDTFECYLGQLAERFPSAKQLERRQSEIQTNPREELRTLILSMSKFYKSFLDDFSLCEQTYDRGIRGAGITLSKVGFCYTVITSSHEMYTFIISTTSEKDQFNYKLTNRKGVLTTFTDEGIFYEAADYLASLIPNGDILDFILIYEDCFAKLGLDSIEF